MYMYMYMYMCVCVCVSYVFWNGVMRPILESTAVFLFEKKLNAHYKKKDNWVGKWVCKFLKYLGVPLLMACLAYIESRRWFIWTFEHLNNIPNNIS